MRSKNYENQIFTEKVEVLEGTSTFENCIFEKGVYIKGDNKRYFLVGEVVRAVFNSCAFHSKGDDPCVALWTRAQGEFVGCKMSSEDFVPVRIDTGAHGVFRDCSIDYPAKRCGVAIMIESSGDFENCCFYDFGEGPAKIEPVYYDGHDKEKTRFLNCTFATINKECIKPTKKNQQ